MLLRTKGTPNCTSENAQVGRVTRDVNALDNTTFFLSENNEVPQSNGFLGVLATSKNIISENTTVFNVPNFEHLENGDIVAVHQVSPNRAAFSL